ncbi:MAG: hypothetical protein IGR92_13675 [Leptolyngbyaceae cyanobacterium T60_A2020_046]|nr:hypothetical protein [Leptolyngbyaceae cyanobacterium T60_A2020_046]
MTSPSRSGHPIQPLANPTAGEPLPPAMQRKVKALVQQIHSVLQRKQLAPEVEAEIGNLVQELDLTTQPQLVMGLLQAALEAEALDEPTRMRLLDLLSTTNTAQKLHSTVDRIHQAMRSQALPGPIQAELSRLLTLLPAIKRSPEALAEFDLAASALLHPVADRGSRNLQLARRLRSELAIKLRQNSNPLGALIFRASGSPHHRLISGLTWFLMLFAGLPATLSVLFFFSGVRQQYEEIGEMRSTISNYESRLEQAQTRTGFLTERVGSASQALASLQLQPLIGGSESGAEEATPSIAQQTALLNTLKADLLAQQAAVRELQALLRELENQEAARLEADLAAPTPNTPSIAASTPTLTRLSETNQAALELADEIDALNRGLEGELLRQRDHLSRARQIIGDALVPESSDSTPSTSGGTGTPQAAAMQPPTVTSAPAIAQRELRDPDSFQHRSLGETLSPASTNSDTWWRDQVIRLIESFLLGMKNVDVPLILAVVSAGAVGSFVSVIVRANDFIEHQEQNHLDLFLVGFFRPVVGMAFAIFLMAVLESGVISGIISVDAVERDRKIYFYIAVPFVAGFSERLIKDIMGKTENLVSGNIYSNTD